MMRPIFLILFIFFVNFSVYCQQYEFAHLNNRNGLSGNEVVDIFKDSRGFLWFATNIGLNRFDGIKFKLYNRDQNGAVSSLYDDLKKIVEDANGNLWLLGNKYVMFDWRSETFVDNTDSLLNTMGLPPNPVSVRVDSNKNFVIAYSGAGVYKYNVATKAVRNYKPSDNRSGIARSEIAEMDVKGDYAWILHKDGVIERLNTITGKIDLQSNYLQGKITTSIIPKSIFIDSDGDVWVYPGIQNKGAIFYDKERDQWNRLDVDTDPKLSNAFVRRIVQDSNGLIWIATDHGGINLFDKKKKSLKVIQSDGFNEKSLSQNSVVSLLCDKDGIVWAGSYKNGVSYYHSNMFKFPKCDLYHSIARTGQVFDCNSITKDAKGDLWIGTNGSGLIRHNEQTGQYQRFRNDRDDTTSLSSDIVTSIFIDHAKKLWVGTFLGGLNVYDGKGFTRYQADERKTNSLSNQSVYGLAEDSDRNLWIATLGGGVDKLDSQRKTFINYNRNNSELQSDFMLSTFTDSIGKVYFCSDIGVYRVDNNTRIMPYFSDRRLQNLVSTNSAYQMMIDSRKNLWIATKMGIKIFDYKSKKLSCLTVDNGLSSNDVRSLIEDQEGNIWAGTSNGLNRIMSIGVKDSQQYSIATFDTNDGLPGSLFNPKAVFKDATGKIYMGTTEGYVGFYPKDIPVNQVVPQARFTDLLISNDVISPKAEKNDHVILSKSIVDLEKITLQYGETNFTIRFSALSFIHPEKNRYKYMLEGVDKNWVEIKDGNGAASYSNLNPGTYKLKVYAGNEDNIWSDTPIVMDIVVNPPFWLSWWALCIYVACVVLLVRSFIKHKLKRQQEKFHHAQRIFEANNLHEIDELKLKFFTNISHEFKTPLSLIISPLEVLMKTSMYKEQGTALSMMHKNARKLLEMVNEILDFRKLDQDKLKLNPSTGNITEFVREICTSFLSIATEKSVKLTFTSTHELNLQFDKEKMYMIVSNLISNAFKYTKHGGHVDVSIDLFQTVSNKDIKKELCLKVSDTGIGIAPEYLGSIFKRFFRIEGDETHGISGTGVGLHIVREFVKLHGGTVDVESSVGQGSVFTVVIPVPNMNDQKIKQDVIYLGGAERKNAVDEQHDLDANPDLAEMEKTCPSLLVIDDNEDFRSFLNDLFINEYKVLVASNGEEGYGIVLEYFPDIILCDVMMPRMDGYEFCRQIKQDVRTSHIPIILLTAKSSDENRYLGIESGADGYISKPFNIDILKITITKIMQRQRLLQERFKAKIDVSSNKMDISPSKLEIVSMDEKFLKKAVSIVELNIGKAEFLVEDLSREMAMSRVNFYKKILALTDKTPSEFIRFIRLKRAADLLVKSQMYVNEVALLVGFNETKYFRKYFKEEFGVTPTEYKKMVTHQEIK